tara:strand:+ start:4789 stop:4983 length:195 start_codon:yes stop_codon:yes gene_type:complete
MTEHTVFKTVENTVMDARKVTGATLEATFRAVSLMAVPILSLVFMTFVIVSIVSLPARLVKRGE